MSDVPQRIGDAERDRAVQELQAHHAAGRLDLAEFDERMQAALQARTNADLVPLFRDLPSTEFSARTLAVPSAPSGAPAPVARSAETSLQRAAKVVVGLMWPLALVINFAFGWEWWWLFIVPAFAAPAILNAVGLESGRQRRQRQAEQRELGRDRRREESE
ncbi:DUF1707 SHOCT-like domain-containing protein [Aestuariimicrobium kwangyangense]|uniref:DUF1707 SHOCT-like domain-containing protein n=1 Tax=Aestuariimicrobium kwangyangense TaxID=396389 RepID=UPI0003B43887|nr:DUF1707 domain-containing protein [Aestuariimicrobium kwangyangense]